MVKYRIGEKFHSVLLLFLLNKGWCEIDEDRVCISFFNSVA